MTPPKEEVTSDERTALDVSVLARLSAQIFDCPLNPTISKFARAVESHVRAASTATATDGEPFRVAVEEMVRMLEEGEWAEHASTFKAPGDRLASRLEAAITDLHNDRAAAPQAGLSDEQRALVLLAAQRLHDHAYYNIATALRALLAEQAAAPMTGETDAADPRGEYKGPNLTFDRLARMRDFAAKQSGEGATVVKINTETLLCLIDTIQHHEYVLQPAADASEHARLSPTALIKFKQTAQDFDDYGETETDHGMLLTWASMGLLECDHFRLTKKGAALVAGEQSNGN